MPPKYFADANQWLVEVGTSWRMFREKIKPGDEIIFPSGMHIPQDFETLIGTKERPIFIRSRDELPAAIVCAQNGLTFKRCQNIVCENLLILNPIEAGIVVDGRPIPGADPNSPGALPAPSGWNADVLIRSCTVAGTRQDFEQDAVRVIGCNDVQIDSVRVDGWNDAAVELQDSFRVLVRGLMMVPSDKYPQRRGVSLQGECADISITACSFNRELGCGVQMGTPIPQGQPLDSVRPVQRIRVDRCMFEETQVPILLVNVRDATISRMTTINPTMAIYAIPTDCGTVERVLIEKCLGYWTPGILKKFSPHPDRIPASQIILGDNLWYSQELPLAFEAIGPPYGYQAMPQVTTVEPSIDITTLRPRSADAVRYGVFSIAAPTGAPTGGTAGDAAPGPVPPPATRAPAGAPPVAPAKAPTTPPANPPKA